MQINNTCNTLLILLSPVPQGSMLDEILLWLKRSILHNFADDNSVTANCKSLLQLINTLKQEFEFAVLWFRQNIMIVNSSKFQAIILNSESKSKANLNICNEYANITDTVKLLEIKIDKDMTFDIHIVNLYCVKSVRIRSFSGPYFPAFGLSTERHGIRILFTQCCILKQQHNSMQLVD